MFKLLQSLMLCGIMLCISGCTSPLDLSGDEEEALQIFSHNLMVSYINKGKIKGRDMELEKSETTTYLTETSDVQRGAVLKTRAGHFQTYNYTIYVPKSDLTMLQSQMPSLSKVQWRDVEKRNGTVDVIWEGVNRTIYRLEFSGDIGKPEKCMYRFSTPPVFQVERGDIFHEPVAPAKGGIRIEALDEGDTP